jgi:hypothetical protein
LSRPKLGQETPGGGHRVDLAGKRLKFLTRKTKSDGPSLIRPADLDSTIVMVYCDRSLDETSGYSGQEFHRGPPSREELDVMGMAGVSIDLNGCDQEPIHIPGSIQPHGMMLVADQDTLIVRHVAGKVEQRLGVPGWEGQHLAR